MIWTLKVIKIKTDFLKAFEDILEILKIRVVEIIDDKIAPEDYYTIVVQKKGSNCILTYHIAKRKFNDINDVLDNAIYIMKTIV